MLLRNSTSGVRISCNSASDVEYYYVIQRLMEECYVIQLPAQEYYYVIQHLIQEYYVIQLPVQECYYLIQRLMQTVADLLMWGGLSSERTGLSIDKSHSQG